MARLGYAGVSGAAPGQVQWRSRWIVRGGAWVKEDGSEVETTEGGRGKTAVGQGGA